MIFINAFYFSEYFIINQQIMRNYKCSDLIYSGAEILAKLLKQWEKTQGAQ